MSERFGLDSVDRVEITALFKNLVDEMLPGDGPVERLPAGSRPKIASALPAAERQKPFGGGHGPATPAAFVQNTVGTCLTVVP
jgi:hypothetical protein